jgi:hypothetical protein
MGRYDLFGNLIRTNGPFYERILKNRDKLTLKERITRIKYINRIIPRTHQMFGSEESYYIFNEVMALYINGEFLSVSILAQAFIERRFQELFYYRDMISMSKKSLKDILIYIEKNKLLDKYLIKNINTIRKKRNPIIHFKPLSHEYSMHTRTFTESRNINEILQNDAKRAIEIMCHIIMIKL